MAGQTTHSEALGVSEFKQRCAEIRGDIVEVDWSEEWEALR